MIDSHPLQVQLLIHYRSGSRSYQVQLPEQAALAERKQHEVLQLLQECWLTLTSVEPSSSSSACLLND